MLLAMNSVCKIEVILKFFFNKERKPNVHQAPAEPRRGRSKDKELIVRVPVIQREEPLCPMPESEYESPL